MASSVSSPIPSENEHGQADDEQLEKAFRRLAAAHRRGRRRYDLLALTLMGAGALVILVGLATALPAFWVLAIGIAIMVASVFAIDQSLEHRERLDELQIWREEWILLRRCMPADPTTGPRFLELLHSNYQHKAS